jgi:hypothetical protein
MAWAGVFRAAREMAEQGTFDSLALAAGAPGSELNGLFAADSAQGSLT